MIEYLGNKYNTQNYLNNSNLNRKRKIENIYTAANMNYSNENFIKNCQISLPLLHQQSFSFVDPMKKFGHLAGTQNTSLELNNSEKLFFPDSRKVHQNSKYITSKKRKAEEITDFSFPMSYRNIGAVDLSSNFQAPLQINPINHNNSINLVSNNNAQTLMQNSTNQITFKANANRSSTADGDYQIVVGENLNSMSQMYEVLSFLGRGTFGQVVKCRCRANNRMVAIKILKNHPSYLRQGNVEIQILQTLSQEDTESYNIVRAIECFQHKNHMCLVFELLEQNLYEYLKSNKFRPMTLPEIRPIAQQVLTALSKLRQLHLIHADLKPENIMLVNPANGTVRYRVKVIDFGSACLASKAVQNTYLQSRYYRAPEILLGYPFNEAIDMWSLGCVIAELFLGWPLYPGSSEYDQLRYIIETQGMPPSEMLKHAGKINRFFSKDSSHEWRLKSQEDYFNETGQRTKETRKYVFTQLDQIRNVSPRPELQDPDYEIEIEDRKQFAHLLIQMLQMRPDERITPDVALNHSLITMNHLQRYVFNKRVRDSFSLMQVVNRNHGGTIANSHFLDRSRSSSISKFPFDNSSLLPFVPSETSHLLSNNPGDLLNPNPDHYFLENFALPNPNMIMGTNNLMHVANIHQNRMLNQQMSLYELVAAGSNALSILAAVTQPTSARDLVHQAMVLQQHQQQSNQIHQDPCQAAATAAAAFVLSNQYPELNEIANLYQKNPIYLNRYLNNYHGQNHVETFIPDSKFLGNSISVQLMQTCDQNVNKNWLEKPPMNLPRQQSCSNNGSFNPFLNKQDSNDFLTSALNRHSMPNNNNNSSQNSKKLAQNIYSSHGQIIHDNTLHQSYHQSVANLISGFDHPTATSNATFNNSDVVLSRPENNESLTALQQILTSPNSSFLNSMQSHQSQMAAALEALQQQNNRELKLSDWKILPNSSSVSDDCKLFNDSLAVQKNLRGLGLPTSNHSNNSEISSYFNLLSKSNQEIVHGLRQSEHKFDFVPLSNNAQSSNRPLLFNPNSIINHTSTMTTSLDMPSSDVLIKTNNTTSQLLSAMQQHFGERNNSFIGLDTTNPLIPTSIDLKLSMKKHESSINNVNKQLPSNWSTEMNTKLLNHHYYQHNPLYEDANQVDIKGKDLNGGNNGSFSFSIKNENSKTDNEGFTEKVSFYEQGNDNKSFLILEGDGTDEDQLDIKFPVTEDDTKKTDSIENCYQIVENKSEKSDNNSDTDHGENIDQKMKQPSNKITSSNESNSKERKNVPVGRVQPMIKEERQSINSSVSSNASNYGGNSNNFDFCRFLNNAASRISTISALNGVNSKFSTRSTYQSLTDSTSLSFDSVQEIGSNNTTERISFNSSKNSAHNILTNPVFADHSSTSAGAFHQQHTSVLPTRGESEHTSGFSTSDDGR